MKHDFLPFGGGGGAPRRIGITRRLIERYMRQRLEAAPLDDARRTVRVGLVGATLFFGLFLLFAMLAPISGAAVATGEVSVSGDRLAIQPVGTGLVAEMLVHEGQEVRPGQPLVRLNGVRSGALLRQAQARRDVLRAAEARLIAERDGLDRLIFPADLGSRSADPTAAAAMKAQLAMFERHRAILEADRRLTDTQLTAAAARRAASIRQLELVNDELEGIQALYAKGFARKTTVRALERTVAQLQADSITGASSIEEAQINRRRTRDAQAMQTVTELNQIQEQLAQVGPQLDISRYYADRDILRAPTAGRVAGLAQVGPGTVVSSGRSLMEIVPTGRALIVETRIKPADIDDVRVGAEATVRFTSVNPRGASSFKGRVVTLSPARVADPNGGEGYFRAQVALDDPAGAARAGVALQPGIPASVNIKTKERTLWDYLIAPLSDAMSRSLREE
ncbi:MAG: HlyD family type I secretion periplasmic adaptor subunit [Pseudomonadota bacterium]|nr:HlyD family type I secretion periplasmic adaptor subunit [Pseudomonadota bacterium]